jgi:hypothetical protein
MFYQRHPLSRQIGSMSPQLIAILGLLFTIAAVVVGILAWQLPKAPASPESSHSPPPSSIAPPCTFKEGSHQLPPTFVGTWSGEMTQLHKQGSSVSYPMTLTLRVPEAGTIVGESSYPRVSCTGKIRVGQVRRDSVVLLEDMISASCGGPFSFTAKSLDSKRIYVSYQLEGGSKKGEGVLSKR